MEIQYDVPVAVRGRPEKYKTDKLVLATVPVTVEIEECSRSELTPAVSVAFGVDDVTRCDFQTHRGRLYLPLEPVATLKQCIPLFELQHVPFVFKRVSHFIEMAAKKEYMHPRPTIYPLAHRDAIRRHRSVVPTPLSEMVFETIDMPTLEQQVSAFEQRASRLLCCDGIVHVEVSEPCISVTRSATNRSAYLLRPLHRPFFGLSKEKTLPDALFRIDESENARDFCLSLGASNAPLLNYHRFRVDVHDPSALSLSSARASCYAVAGNLCRSAERQPPYALDRELQELGSLVSDHNESSCPDHLGDALSAIVDIHRSGTAVFQHNSEIAGAVADMWDNREITITSPAHSANGASRP
ncbi:hypothetical protein HFO56_24905 [Rhizobium laguerreae]|uniref:hypothetical protein n=1 Tax=Rhizobium laguerreae TaxID=1076926 RepID=UPI001C905D83|nr:hypothetical protein [Rhizobium laguerreae]MBY3155570.1 hypothetical protein [Rhizobium laguerreae]